MQRRLRAAAAISYRAKAHLPELIAVMEPLAQDPTDASARLRLYELRDLLQEDE